MSALERRRALARLSKAELIDLVMGEECSEVAGALSCTLTGEHGIHRDPEGEWWRMSVIGARPLSYGRGPVPR